MRYTLFYILALIMIVSCSDGHDESSYIRPEGFVEDIKLPVTPVADQGATEFCWIYAAIAAIETDRLAQGDSISLSPLWLERLMMQEATENAFFVGGKVSLRGTLPMAMHLIERYGLVSSDAYHSHDVIIAKDGKREVERDNLDSRVLSRQLTHLARTYHAQHRSLKDLSDALGSLLNDSIGFAPNRTYLYGAEYSPKEFAHSCFLPGEWQAYTSFSHHPYGESFAPELKDNQWNDTAMNIPMDSLLDMTIKSLQSRHPVMWEGCMKTNIPEDRQKTFEQHVLTDDHCMCIIGMGHDAKGTKYFILKNSWGMEDGDHGFRYMSIDQFRRSTILVEVSHKVNEK